MESFELLGPLATRLHADFCNVFYLLLPVFFALSIVFAWFKNPVGGPDFLESLKRACVAVLLLVGFQEITGAILALTSGIADRVSDMNGLDAIMKMAGEKSRSYTLSPTSLILGFNDLLIAILSFLSYLFLYIARYLMVALYHFSWIFLVLISPILLLFHLFSPKITLNLFRSLMEVACWNIVWSVLSAMLAALPFGNAYVADGNYLTVIVLNFVIGICMLGTPLVVRSLIGSGLTAMTSSLGPAVATMMVLAPAKAIAAAQFGRRVLTDTKGYMGHQSSRMGNRGGTLFGQRKPPPENKNEEPTKSTESKSNKTPKPPTR